MARILVSLDGSEHAEQALGPALGLLADQDELELLRVVDQAQLAEAELAESYLRELVVRLRDRGLDARLRVLVRAGDPAAEIVAAARQHLSDRIVLCSHGRSGISRWLLGSVAEEVVRQSPCPVWLTPARSSPWEVGPTRLGQILLPLDGSPEGERSLAYLRDWEPARGASLVLLTAVDLPISLSTPPPADLRRYLELQAQQLQAQGWVVTTRVTEERAADAIVQAAEELRPDLAIMATHGLHGLRRWWEGSVSETVGRRCPCSLLLLPPGVPPA